MKVLLTSCILVVTFTIISFVSFANDPFENDIKEKYQYQNWGGIAQTNYIRMVKNWEFDFSLYGATNLISKSIEDNDDGIFDSFYTFQPTNMPSQISLRIIETPSIQDAHETLIFFCTTSAAPQPFPLGTLVGLNFGEFCYTGYPTNSTSSITFVRNNVYIQIRANDETSVTNIATKVDQQLLSISLKP